MLVFASRSFLIAHSPRLVELQDRCRRNSASLSAPSIHADSIQTRVRKVIWTLSVVSSQRETGSALEMALQQGGVGVAGPLDIQRPI